MEICKVPALQLRALNKYNTHNVHQDENVITISAIKNIYKNIFKTHPGFTIPGKNLDFGAQQHSADKEAIIPPFSIHVYCVCMW